MKSVFKFLIPLVVMIGLTGCDTAIYPGNVRVADLEKIPPEAVKSYESLSTKEKEALITEAAIDSFLIFGSSTLIPARDPGRAIEAAGRFSLKITDETLNTAENYLLNEIFPSGEIIINKAETTINVSAAKDQMDFKRMVFGGHGEFDAHAMADVEVKNLVSEEMEILYARLTAALNASLTGNLSYDSTTKTESTVEEVPSFNKLRFAGEANYKASGNMSYGTTFVKNGVGIRLILTYSMRNLDSTIRVEDLIALFDSPDAAELQKYLAAIYGDGAPAKEPYFTITATVYDNNDREIGVTTISDRNIAEQIKTMITGGLI